MRSSIKRSFILRPTDLGRDYKTTCWYPTHQSELTTLCCQKIADEITPMIQRLGLVDYEIITNRRGKQL